MDMMLDRYREEVRLLRKQCDDLQAENAALRDVSVDRIDAALEEARRMVEANKRALELLVAARQARSHALCHSLLDAIGLVLGEIQDDN